ncbi:MAG: histidinol-phosphate transaminase [Anaerolineales bacterium]
MKASDFDQIFDNGESVLEHLDLSQARRPSIEPAAHGALDFAELERLGLRPEDVLDFSVNSNPFGPSPKVWDAIRQTPLERYPDRESLALRRELSQRLDVSPAQIVVGNGTAELIQLAALAFLSKGDSALITEPTFGEYERAVRLMDGNVRRWRAVPETGFAFRPDEIQKRLENVRMAFLCNPNNPTGQVLPLETLDEWAKDFPNTLFVVDEAYLAFVPDMKSAVTLRRKNILTLRSMTKDYALAGLRLGYAAGDEAVIQAIVNLRPAWNVNALAQAAGLAALQDEVHQRETLTQLRSETQKLVEGLRRLGFNPVPSRTHYFLLPVASGADFRQKLLAQGVLVRDCASFGLPAYVRLATRMAEENARLLRALASS